MTELTTNTEDVHTNNDPSQIDTSHIINNQLFIARIKSNEVLVTFLKSLTISSWFALVATILISHYVIKPQEAIPSAMFLMLTSWILFTVSICCALHSIARVTYNLDVPDKRVGESGLSLAFIAGSEALVVLSRPALFAFIFGMFFFLVFIIINYKMLLV